MGMETSVIQRAFRTALRFECPTKAVPTPTVLDSEVLVVKRVLTNIALSQLILIQLIGAHSIRDNLSTQIRTHNQLTVAKRLSVVAMKAIRILMPVKTGRRNIEES